jgi:hypothetical protein
MDVREGLCCDKARKYFEMDSARLKMTIAAPL